MAKKSKLKTPDWVLQGKEKPKNTSKVKTFKIRRCPGCKNDDVGVILGGEEGKGSNGWECHKCNWKGEDIEEEELTEEQFMKYLDEKGEGVA